MIPPGGEGAIEVRYDTRNRLGRGTKGVSVHTNDPTTPVAALFVHAELALALVAEPNALDVGPIEWGERVVREVRLAGPDGADTRARAVSYVPASHGSWPGRPEVELLGRVDSPEGTTAYQVAIGPATEPGRFLGTLAIETDNLLVENVDVRLSGEIRAPIAHRPASLVLMNLRPGHPSSRRIRLTPSGGATLDRVTASTDHPELDVSVTATPAGGAVVVTWTGPVEGAPGEGVVTIVTGNPVVPEITVPVRLVR